MTYEKKRFGEINDFCLKKLFHWQNNLAMKERS